MTKSAGSKPVLFMTWDYVNRNANQARIERSYTDLGAAHNVPVAVPGIAFKIYRDKYPSSSIHSDQIHPNNLGTYLAACTFYSFFSGKSPVGLSYTFGLNATDARRAQEVAWEATQQYGQFYR